MPTTTAVRDVMTSKVITLRPDQTFEEAADVLADHKIGAAPVVDGDGKVVGVVRDEDLIVSEGNLHAPTTFNILGTGISLPREKKRFEEELRRMVAADVAGLMTTEFATCGPDDTVADVVTSMHDDDVTHMPVIDGDGTLVGIIARGDIVRHLAQTT